MICDRTDIKTKFQRFQKHYEIDQTWQKCTKINNNFWANSNYFDYYNRYFIISIANSFRTKNNVFTSMVNINDLPILAIEYINKRKNKKTKQIPIVYVLNILQLSIT